MRRLFIAVTLVAAFVLGSFLPMTLQGASWVRPQTILAQDQCQTFAETGKTVCGIFLSYWRANGGLAQQGYPISDTLSEQSAIDGKTYEVQYFERAVFERHPENAGTTFEVLLNLLGAERWRTKYPAGLSAGETAAQSGQTFTVLGYKPNGTFRVRTDGIEERDQYPDVPGCTNESKAKGKFVTLLVHIENLGNESDFLQPPRLKDRQGRLFDTVASYCAEVSAAEFHNRRVDSATLQPGFSEDVVMVFDIVPDAQPVSVVPRTH